MAVGHLRRVCSQGFMSNHGLVLFGLVYLLATASPAPGIAAIIARVLSYGTPGMAGFIAGFVMGDLIWFSLVATGWSGRCSCIASARFVRPMPRGNIRPHWRRHGERVASGKSFTRFNSLTGLQLFYHEVSKDKIDRSDGYDGGARIAAGSNPFGAKDDTHCASPIVFDGRGNAEGLARP
jgi:hypothetical protein